MAFDMSATLFHIVCRLLDGAPPPRPGERHRRRPHLVQKIAAGQETAGGFERETLGVAAADILRGLGRLVLRHAKLAQRHFTELER
jgi:hypothetical protein